MAPLITTPGGNPVTELPGLRPRFPVTIVAPVLVTVEAPKMAKVSGAPSGAVWAISDQGVASSPKIVNLAATDLWTCFFCAELFCMGQMQAAWMLHTGAANTHFRPPG